MLMLERFSEVRLPVAERMVRGLRRVGGLLGIGESQVSDRNISIQRERPLCNSLPTLDHHLFDCSVAPLTSIFNPSFANVLNYSAACRNTLDIFSLPFPQYPQCYHQVGGVSTPYHH
jgi:hypothetical protein